MTKRTEKRPGGTATGANWWKAWVLVTSVGTTLFGWLAFTGSSTPAANALVSPEPAPVRAAAPVIRVNAVYAETDFTPTVRTLPRMPQKPVFQAPVTRTRRS